MFYLLLFIVLGMPLIPEVSFDLYRLAVYCAVVEHHSFSRAAEELLVSQPAVSTHVRALEAAFHNQLLDRSHREIVTTEAGAAVYSLARDILARTRETSEVVADLRSGESGRLSLGGTTTIGNYVLPGMLAKFRSSHPGARIRMRVGTRSRIMDDVVSGDVEFGYMETGDLPKGLAAERMNTEQLVFFVAPHHRLASQPVGADELRGQELVTGISGTSYYAAMVERQLRQLGLAAAPAAMEMGAPEATKRVVAATTAVGLLPRPAVAGEIARGELAELHVEGAALWMSYQLVYRRHIYRSPLAVAFLASMKSLTAPKKSSG